MHWFLDDANLSSRPRLEEKRCRRAKDKCVCLEQSWGKFCFSGLDIMLVLVTFQTTSAELLSGFTRLLSELFSGFSFEPSFQFWVTYQFKFEIWEKKLFTSCFYHMTKPLVLSPWWVLRRVSLKWSLFCLKTTGPDWFHSFIPNVAD